MNTIAARIGAAVLFSTSLGFAQGAAHASSTGDDDSTSPAAAQPSTAEAQSNLKTEKHDSTAPNSDAKPAAPAPAVADQESGDDATYGHGLQFGLRGGIVFGYKMDIRYDKSPYCHTFDPSKAVGDQQKFCGFGAPTSTEVALSFAPLDSVEPYVFGRFGFSGESETNTKPLQLFGIGARIYTMSDSRFKMFVEPALAWETEGGAGNPDWNRGLNPSYKRDLIFHVGVGPQYDFAKAFGVFLNAGIDVGVLRDISAAFILNVGIQLRFL